MWHRLFCNPVMCFNTCASRCRFKYKRLTFRASVLLCMKLLGTFRTLFSRNVLFHAEFAVMKTVELSSLLHFFCIERSEKSVKHCAVHQPFSDFIWVDFCPASVFYISILSSNRFPYVDRIFILRSS